MQFWIDRCEGGGWNARFVRGWRGAYGLTLKPFRFGAGSGMWHSLKRRAQKSNARVEDALVVAVRGWRSGI